MREILQSYLRKLTNLSSNNRSLYLPRLVNNHFIDLHELDFVDNKPSFSIIEQLIYQKPRIVLSAEHDSRSDVVNQASNKLKRIARSEKFIFEERGAMDLYVGWPFVRGKLNDGSAISAPLIFFPTTLNLKGGKWELILRKESEITFNKSFILAYAHFNEIQLDELILEHSFDEPNDDSRSFRTDLYNMLKESHLEINFNQDIFNDALTSFSSFKKPDFIDAHQNGQLKLFPEAVLGIFPQADSYIVPDYMNLLERPMIPDIEEFFEKRSAVDDQINNQHSDIYRFLNKVKEEQTFTPYPIDAYQENALKAVKKGNSLVIQGPPGTGKSQLICNMIADFIARGKKVLVVCQKRAALDVVHQRLKEKAIQNFIGLVHDFKHDRKYIYAQIASQIDKLYEYQMKNNSLDSIQLERSFLKASRRIDQISEEFEEYKFALYDETECGLSAKELYLISQLHGPSINLKQEYRFFSFENLDKVLRKFRNYFSYALDFDRLGHPWYDRKSFKELGIKDLKEITNIISDIPAFQEEILKESAAIVNTGVRIEDCEATLYKEKEINKLLKMLDDDMVYKYFTHMVQTDKNDMDLLWLTNSERVLLDCFKGEGPEQSLKAEELGKFQEVLERAIKARKNIFKSVWWQIFSKDKYWIKRVIVANDITSDKKSLEILIEKIDNRLNLEHNLSKIKENTWLKDIPDGFRKADFQSWFYDQKAALASKLIFNSLRNFKTYFNVPKMSFPKFKKGIEDLFLVFHKVADRKKRWLEYLTPFQINHLLENPDRGELLIKSLNKDFDALCEFDKLSAELNTEEKEVIAKLMESTNSPKIEELLKLFENSLQLAWLDHIETKYPILRSVSSKKFEQLENEIQESVEEKQDISTDILLMKAREITYQDAQYNRLNNRVTYKDLQHQVTKKRKIWPIRKLISNFSDELFDLIPCWMASPESVSALFPMEEFFDLVIFDEASQCFAEKGIPAMYRGKQIVISGDDKQLKPNDLYKARWEEDSEIPAADLDSLLDLSNQYLMQLQLQGHYRSQSLALIEFSNLNFYGGNLKLLPDFNHINSGELPIECIKVDGTWKNNTNEIEAKRVVELVSGLYKTSPEKSIGVITFNAKQQNLIQDLMETHAVEQEWQIPESLFVKNIENVQGDEKDVIIFSTAYAPDEKGKMIMQFGSLNQIGGENRLNVAITRAKQKIFIVTSIHSSSLSVEDSKNEGPKLLKKYLAFAESVSKNKYKPYLPKTEDYHIEWYLKNKLVELSQSFGFDTEIVNELPFADLSIKNNKDFTGLILTDDDLYYQTISMKEPHVYKPFLMDHKNWKYVFFNSREYWQHQEELKEKLHKFLQEQREND